MKIIKKDLYDKIFEKNKDLYSIQEIRKNDIQGIIDALLETLIEELMKGNSIELRGFGVFERIIKRARNYAINPQTGREVETKDYYKVSFHPGKKVTRTDERDSCSKTRKI